MGRDFTDRHFLSAPQSPAENYSTLPHLPQPSRTFPPSRVDQRGFFSKLKPRRGAVGGAGFHRPTLSCCSSVPWRELLNPPDSFQGKGRGTSARLRLPSLRQMDGKEGIFFSEFCLSLRSFNGREGEHPRECAFLPSDRWMGRQEFCFRSTSFPFVLSTDGKGNIREVALSFPQTDGWEGKILFFGALPFLSAEGKGGVLGGSPFLSCPQAGETQKGTSGRRGRHIALEDS